MNKRSRTDGNTRPPKRQRFTPHLPDEVLCELIPYLPFKDTIRFGRTRKTFLEEIGLDSRLDTNNMDTKEDTNEKRQQRLKAAFANKTHKLNTSINHACSGTREARCTSLRNDVRDHVRAQIQKYKAPILLIEHPLPFSCGDALKSFRHIKKVIIITNRNFNLFQTMPKGVEELEVIKRLSYYTKPATEGVFANSLYPSSIPDSMKHITLTLESNQLDQMYLKSEMTHLQTLNTTDSSIDFDYYFHHRSIPFDGTYTYQKVPMTFKHTSAVEHRRIYKDRGWLVRHAEETLRAFEHGDKVWAHFVRWFDLGSEWLESTKHVDIKDESMFPLFPTEADAKRGRRLFEVFAILPRVVRDALRMDGDRFEEFIKHYIAPNIDPRYYHNNDDLSDDGWACKKCIRKFIRDDKILVSGEVRTGNMLPPYYESFSISEEGLKYNY